MTQIQAQPPRIESDDAQKIRMHVNDARRALSSLSAVLARLAGLTHNPMYALLSKTADTWREELDKAVK
jgi:hypothetical protein